MITGVVIDSAGTPILGAIVVVTDLQLRTTTDEEGRFRLVGAMPRSVELHVRRLGYTPVVWPVELTGSEPHATAEIRIAALATSLAPVVVQTTAAGATGRLSGYYKRLQHRSGGKFIARPEIDRQSHRQLTQLISASAALQFRRLRSGATAVRIRGRTCVPLVWLDGMPLAAGSVDLDAYTPTALHGIELYPGSASVPLPNAGMPNRGDCASILLWSRGRDTDPPLALRRRSLDVDGLVSSGLVYTADQVDKPAAMVEGLEDLIYPPDMYATGIAGRVVAEFVVDETGHVEHGTLAIVSSTHPLFSVAVVRALERATYSPALAGGHSVRQVVQQPFGFSPPRAHSQRTGY